jgi:hypothetical protein
MNLAIGKAVRFALVSLCSVALLELGVFVSAERAAEVYRIGSPFPIPSGFLLDGAYLQPTRAHCYLIRITADACPYCKQDEARYSSLAAKARALGCEVIAVAPRAGQMAPMHGGPAVQLKYVDMRLGTILDPFLTPQTILLDEAGRVAWERQGSMSDRDQQAAARALAGLADSVAPAAGMKAGT